MRKRVLIAGVVVAGIVLAAGAASAQASDLAGALIKCRQMLDGSAKLGCYNAISTADGSTPIPSQAYSDGLADRVAYEAWFAALGSTEQDGAEYWAAQRSQFAPRPCIKPDSAANDLWVTGCRSAQRWLAPTDARRKSEPEYRAGWNAFVSLAPAERTGKSEPAPLPLLEAGIEPTIDLLIENPLRPIFHGKTNLPDGSELMLTLSRPETLYMAQSKVTVNAGLFRTAQFSANNQPLNPGRYKITITMAIAYLQPHRVQEIIGDHGQRMRGKFVSASPLGGSVFEYIVQKELGGPANTAMDEVARAREITAIRKWLVDGCSSNIDLVNAMVRSGAASGRQILGAERQAKIDACTVEANSRSFD